MTKKILTAVAAVLLLAACAPAGAAPLAAVSQQTWGAQRSCTTNTSGVCTVPHDMGVVPDGVTASLVNRSGLVRVQSKTATGITILAAKSVASNGTPSPWASVSVTVELVAAYTPATVPTTTPATTAPTTTPPVGARECPAFPAFPDASCTGVPAGTTLTPCSGNITQANLVLDGCLFSGGVYLGPDADNVTIKNSKVTGRVNAGYGGDTGSNGQTGLVLTDVEIDGEDANPNNESGIGDDNYTCIRCNVHRTGRGASARFNVTIIDSWFHDFDHRTGDHESAIGSNGGHDMTFRHNNLECQPTTYCSGALVVYNQADPVNNVLVEKNLFEGGSYCTYAGSTQSPPGTNVRYLDNRFSRSFYPNCGYYGPVSSWDGSGTGNVWSGNAWADGSGPVNP